MVYNALKLFMEINPEMFDECMQQYKETRLQCVFKHCSMVSPSLCVCFRERQRLVERYEGWQKMREIALKNAGDTAPEELSAEYPPPPPEEDEDLGDLSIDLSAAAMDAEVAQALDDSGIERVPVADPIGNMPMPDEPGSPIGQSPHVRRKSVLPGE